MRTMEMCRGCDECETEGKIYSPFHRFFVERHLVRVDADWESYAGPLVVCVWRGQDNAGTFFKSFTVFTIYLASLLDEVVDLLELFKREVCLPLGQVETVKWGSLKTQYLAISRNPVEEGEVDEVKEAIKQPIFDYQKDGCQHQPSYLCEEWHGDRFLVVVIFYLFKEQWIFDGDKATLEWDVDEFGRIKAEE